MTALFTFTFLDTAHAQGVSHNEQQRQVQTQQAEHVSNAAFSLQSGGTSHPDSLDKKKPMSSAPRSNDDGVGPASFCNIFFGN